MDKTPAISIKNLTKIFKLYKHPADMIKELFLRKSYHRDFTALDNISFDIKKGEIVGIVGPNGSGKSTLLKIIAGTLDKTSGYLRTNGRISAILELGLGFNSEQTGRENIYNGAMVFGMGRKEIDKKIQSIIDFSELGQFIDQPFKTYSSGMQTRLTFSVASAIDPEILIIDEALAAGDTFFMAKCTERIHEICASGATVLFVSHFLPTVQKLCSRAIYLKKGEIIKDGPSGDVCQTYQNDIMEEISEKLRHENAVNYSKKARKWQKGPIDFTKVQILDKEQKEKYSFHQNDKLTIRLNYLAKKPLKNISAWIVIYRSDGVFATSFLSCNPYQELGEFKGDGYVDITWDKIYLCEGQYVISCGLYPYEEKKLLSTLPTDSYVYHDKCYKFQIKQKGWPSLAIYEQPAKVTNKVIKK